MEKRRVVITGLGAVSPIGNTAVESWAAVREGKCGIGPITRYDTTDRKVKLAGEVKNFDAAGLLGKRECKKLDLFTQYAVSYTHLREHAAGSDPPYAPGAGGVYCGWFHHERLPFPPDAVRVGFCARRI